MKTLYKILLVLILFADTSVFGQSNRFYETNPDRKRAFNWLFGDSIWLDFKTNPPILNSGSQLQGLESATAISDTSGNLLLYSDGNTIWNINHNVIINGTGLHGNSSSSQGSLFIKNPFYDSIVYLFTTDAQGGAFGLQMSMIRISKNPDSSLVEIKNRKLIAPVCESIAATQHQNGKYTWITVHSKTGNTFYSFLIDSFGVNTCPIISFEGYIYDGNVINCQTTSAFSDNGKYFGINLLLDFKLQVLEFNNSTGAFKLLRQFTNLAVPTGIAFDNNSNLIYVVERGKQINQINLNTWQNNIIESIKNKYLIIQIEKTPYKDILVNVLDSFYLGRIKKPDLLGLSSNFSLREIYLNNKKNKNGLCNFNQSYFYAPSIDFAYNYDCTSNSISFEGRDTFYADAHLWSIGKIGKPLEATYNNKNIIHAFKDTGQYQVSYIAFKNTRSDTVIKTITIYPKVKKDFLGRDTGIETGISFTKTLKAPMGMHCYFWQNDSSSSVTFTTDTPGTFICKISSPSFCVVTDTIVIAECINDLVAPIIKRSSDTLYVNHTLADSFVWFRNDVFYKITIAPYLQLTDTGTYRVEAAKKGHCNKSSVTQAVNQLGIKGIERLSSLFRIYPNPASNVLNIELQQEGTFDIKIYDVLGQLIHQQATESSTQIDIKNLPVGVYLIQINNSDNQQLNLKFLKG